MFPYRFWDLVPITLTLYFTVGKSVDYVELIPTTHWCRWGQNQSWSKNLSVLSLAAFSFSSCFNSLVLFHNVDLNHNQTQATQEAFFLEGRFVVFLLLNHYNVLDLSCPIQVTSNAGPTPTLICFMCSCSPFLPEEIPSLACLHVVLIKLFLYSRIPVFL